MSETLTRRGLLKWSGLALAAEALPPRVLLAKTSPSGVTRLNLNENAFGPSRRVSGAIQRELSSIARYADATSAQTFTEQIAAYERVPAGQIILGEILGALGQSFGSAGGPGGEFIYTTPGYLALVDAASRVGGVGVPVALNAQLENDLPAILSRIGARTRAIYLINPHNPTGTLSEDRVFQSFLREASQKTPVIVDEAYLEYSPDFAARSAVSLVREGADVLVFRTFDKIHGLAGLPIGYTIAPSAMVKRLRAQGLGDAEALGRLNIAAASAALADVEHVADVRAQVGIERAKWNGVLDELKLRHTPTTTNFVFFDGGRPQTEVASRLSEHGVQVGRAFPPYTSWVRITIGLPAENLKAQHALRFVLERMDPQS